MAEVIVHSMGNLRQQIDAESHTFYADEPVDDGGDNAGPTPYDLLLGALGACTSMTLLLYARRKGWPLEDVEVRLSHERDYARDCAECDTKPVQIDQIERRITLKGQLDQSQRARLLGNRRLILEKHWAGSADPGAEIGARGPIGAECQRERHIRGRRVGDGIVDVNLLVGRVGVASALKLRR